MKDSNKYKILFNFASRSRPEKLKKACHNILQKVTDLDNLCIMIALDIDDPTNTYELKDYLFQMHQISVVDGMSKNKIHAINRAVPQHLFNVNGDWDILVNMSDDMEFLKKGFDDQIRKDFGSDLDQFLHYPDGFQNENLSTMTIIGREYYKRTNYVYNPEYQSLWCDVEAQEVAKRLGKYKYIPLQLFVHNHPAWGRTAKDEQYVHTESFDAIDRQTYQQRLAKNFDL